MNTFENMVEM